MILWSLKTSEKVKIIPCNSHIHCSDERKSIIAIAFSFKVPCYVCPRISGGFKLNGTFLPLICADDINLSGENLNAKHHRDKHNIY
jgi:hypothetical protein